MCTYIVLRPEVVEKVSEKPKVSIADRQTRGVSAFMSTYISHCGTAGRDAGAGSPGLW